MRNAVTAGKTAEKIESGKKRRSGSMATGGKGVAAQCVTLVSTIFAFAVERGLCADNPARGVKKAAVRKVERFLTEGEIARLAEALDAEVQRSGNPYPCAAIKLLLLTGCRRGEMVNLRWEHVDFEHECLRLPDSKTGAKVVYLNPPARVLLQELPRMAAWRLTARRPSPLADARRSLEFATALYHSAASGTAVTLPIATDHPSYNGWRYPPTAPWAST
jgi:integrase